MGRTALVNVISPKGSQDIIDPLTKLLGEIEIRVKRT